MQRIPGSNRLQIHNLSTCSGDRLAAFRISNGGVINFHNPSGDEAWISNVSASLAELGVYCGCPTSIIEVDNSIFVPDYNCLYDSEGRRILESCIRRGIRLDEIDPPESITLPQCVSSVDSPLVYLGVIFCHWGHFLTESISRLWSLDGYLPTEDNLLFFGGPYSGREDNRNSISAFLNSGTFRQEIYRGIAGPTKIRKALVPLASFSIRSQAYSAHAIFPHKVAERLLVGRALTAKSDRPVYLSRSRLPNSGRVIRNEVEFEKLLKSFGVLICYPETMTLEDQVILFNEYSTFIGCWGSALHNLVFCLNVCGVTVHILSKWRVNTNYFLFDAILGMESHYINCLRATPGEQELDGPMIDMYIDIDLMLSYLSENRII